MNYIDSLYLPSDHQETGFLMSQRRTCYNGCYPYKIFPQKGLSEINFAPITIFYGGNGSGKTTLLNVIAEKTNVLRHSAFSGSAFFANYVSDCEIEGKTLPENSLSIALQQELCKYIVDSARHFGCQFIMSTHSPILLSIKDALIYDLDSDPVKTSDWTELENVRRYFDFFEEHRNEFL